MKVGTLRFVVVAVITSLLLVAGSTTAWAQSPNYPSDFNLNQDLLTRNGDATFEHLNVSGPFALQLTRPAGNSRGSAWFNVQQPVQNGFTTTFQFQITPVVGSPTTADGIAFVLQNSAAAKAALGDGGGGIGYQGIPKSIAVEFDTYTNSLYDPNNNHVAVQSCGTDANSSDHNAFNSGNQPCKLAINSSLTFENDDDDANPSTTIHLADGLSHTATITYTPPSCSTCLGSLVVTLDGHDLFGGVPVDLGTIGLASGDAWAGFTAGTGADWETQDILSWTFKAQAPAEQTTVFNFPNHNYLVTPDEGQATTTVQVTPILMSQGACNLLVQANPLFVTPLVPSQTAQCFVYKDVGVPPDNDSSVMYEVICPDSAAGCNPFNAELGTTYDLSTTGTNNSGFSSANPFPGWLKGDGGVLGHPCTPSSGPLFASNQVSFFDFNVNDPVTKGKSGGTGSCWVATYNTPNETPTVNVVTPTNNANYPVGPTVAVNAAFTCDAVNTSPGSTVGPFGPYLTVPPGGCTATLDGVAITPGSPINNTVGPHTFIAKVVDSATDTVSSTVNYNVVGPADLAILKLAPLLVRAGGTITYTIGVGNLGGSNAVGVVVSDTLPANTTLVGNATGNNVSCAIVNKKLTCSTTPMTCTGGPTVSCSSTTPIVPLSLSSLNGATVKITVQLGSAWTAGKVVKNTASVSSTNADSKPNNNNSTAATLVTR